MSGARAAELHRIKEGIECEIADHQSQIKQLFVELAEIKFEILAHAATVLWTEIPRDRTIKLDLPEAA